MKFRQILKSRKGFTLMELIIVLIIVAILAAALIPSFLGFMSRARNDSLYAQARTGMVAAQVIVTENLGELTEGQLQAIMDQPVSLTDPTTGKFQQLVAGDVDNEAGFTDVKLSANGWHVTGLTYTTPAGSVTIEPPSSDPSGDTGTDG